MAGVMVVLSFVMCSKDVAKIIKTADTTPLATATGPTLNTGNPTQTISANTCSYTVKASDWLLDGATFGPGSVICIPAGTRGALLLKNFKGTAASPITIINKGGGLLSLLQLRLRTLLKRKTASILKYWAMALPALNMGLM